MKKYIFLFFVILEVFPTHGQQLYRYINSDKDLIVLSEEKFFITLKDTNDLREFKTPFIKTMDRINNKGTYLAQTSYKIKYSEVLEYFKKHEGVSYLSPVIFSNGNELGGYTSEIIVKLEDNFDVKELEELIRKYNLHIAYRSQLDGRTFYLFNEEKDALNNQIIANALNETGVFKCADPNYLLFVQLANDEKFPYQWYLHNTEQFSGIAGEDIKAPEAWINTTGSSSVRIAIIDTGVELTHEDLEENMATGYDATGGSSGGAAFAIMEL